MALHTMPPHRGALAYFFLLHTAHFYARKTWSRTENFCTNAFTKQRSTHGCFYTQRLWQTRTSLTHTPMPLHTNVLIHRSFCAQELTQSKPSHTHKCFYTENFCTHNSSTFRKLLHAKALTHRKRSHSDGFLNTNSFYTQKFLHTHIFYT